MKKIRVAISLFVLLLCAGAALAAQPVVGPVVEVAPKAEGTRSQAWPSAAWSEGAGCWLVVWREGWLNDGKTDIWCARVSRDGKALDPAGIRITSARDIQDRPRVASDGKGFLVVWEDLRNGKDWDVYAARVLGDGNVLDEGGFLVAGGEHNQVRPDVAFTGGIHIVTWMNFEPDSAWTRSDTPGVQWPNAGFYRIYASRVSPWPQKPLVQKAVKVIEQPATNAYMPVIAACGENVLVQAFTVHGHRCMINRRQVSRATGQPTVPAITVGQPAQTRQMHLGHGQSQAGLAFGSEGGLSVHSDSTNLCVVWPLDKGGKPTTEFPTASLSAGPGYSSGKGFNFVYQRRSVSFDGEHFLCVTDNVADDGSSDVVGWYLTSHGQALDSNAFAIARDGLSNVQGIGVGGPNIVSLVVYRAERGMDDAKVLARLVRMR